MSASRSETATAFSSLMALHLEHVRLMQNLEEAEKVGPPPEKLVVAIRAFVETAVATGARLSVPSDRADAQGVVTYWTSVLRSCSAAPENTVLVRFDTEQEKKKLGQKNPYKGLAPFQGEDAELFFGRREIVMEMVKVLGSQRLLVVLGLSGSGKSSVVRAGLLPALHDDAITGSKDWRQIGPFVPGSDPIASLAEALRPPDENIERWKEVVPADLRLKPGSLPQLLSSQSVPTLLVIDQLEEVFTLLLSDDDRNAFFRNIADLLRLAAVPSYVILTMRSEFHTLLTQTDLDPLMQDSRVRVPPLQLAGLRDAIEKPAERYGVRIDPDVVQSLIKNMQNEPAGLPLLEFALLKLWQSRDLGENRITKEAYETLGGTPQQILVRSADEAYQTFKLPEDQDRCRHLFTGLVKPGDSLEVTSRRRSLKELSFIGEEHVKRILSVLEPAGLLRITPAIPEEQSQVELSHESLTRNWPQLVTWVKEDLTRLRRRQLLEETATQWKRAPDTVTPYAGAQLAEALAFPDLIDVEKEFLAASRTDDKQRTISRWVAMVLLILLAAGFASMWISSQRQTDRLKAALLEAQVAKNDAIDAKARADSDKVQADQALLAATQILLRVHPPSQVSHSTQQLPSTDRVAVWMMIPDERFRPLARSMTDALRASDPQWLLPGIQTLDPSKFLFQKSSQLRFFRDETDVSELAMKLTGLLSKIAPVSFKYVNPDIVGVGKTTLPKYQFELWIGLSPTETPGK